MRRIAVAVMSLLVVMVGWFAPAAGPAAGATNPDGSSCTVTIISRWATGFTATIRVTAGTTPFSTWWLTLTTPNAVVNTLWNGRTLVVDPHTLVIGNQSWNSPLPAGASTDLGFYATGSPDGLTCEGPTAIPRPIDPTVPPAPAA